MGPKLRIAESVITWMRSACWLAGADHLDKRRFLGADPRRLQRRRAEGGVGDQRRVAAGVQQRRIGGRGRGEVGRLHAACLRLGQIALVGQAPAVVEAGGEGPGEACIIDARPDLVDLLQRPPVPVLAADEYAGVVDDHVLGLQHAVGQLIDRQHPHG
ncbi:hypothetical protein FHR66_001797 [Xanthomonas sp. F4]